MGERITHEVDAATLPGRLQNLGDRRLQPLMGVGDDEFYAAQPSATELAQKLGPEGLGFRRADVHAQHFPAAVGVDPHGDNRRQRDDAAVLPRFHIGCVDPEVVPVTFDRPLEESFHPLVDFFAQAADLALRDAAHAHGLDEIVHRARRDALDVGFLNDGRQRLLGHPPRLQEARKIAALS